jgi:hypothetical protein
MTDTARRRRAEQKAKLAGSGQWLDPPKPPKPKLTLTERVCAAISKGRGMAKVADEIHGDLDLPDEVIIALGEGLSFQIEERLKLDAALKGVLDKRAALEPTA